MEHRAWKHSREISPMKPQKEGRAVVPNTTPGLLRVRDLISPGNDSTGRRLES